MNCLFPKCVAANKCQGHKVTYPVQPHWQTIAQPFHAGRYVGTFGQKIVIGMSYSPSGAGWFND